MGSFLARVADWLTDSAHWHRSASFAGIPALLGSHLELVGLSLLLAMAVALPAGLVLGHTGRGGFLAINVTNVGRALPALALLTLAFQAFGIGLRTPLLSITLLSIPPILTNTYTAIRSVDQADRDAARGMGMTPLQVLARVEVPSSVPLIFAGVRTAAVQAVATATLAALVAYDCLGSIIELGLGRNDQVEIFSGAVLVVALALVVEVALALVQRAVTPTGLRLADRRVARRRLRQGGADGTLVDATVGWA
ncbi:MAG TPA: ABC transporter permease subunit [Acidimicrobiales bacterium]|nr:ABC transporter permease subunit [Acidimicrobiales bacterium]